MKNYSTKIQLRSLATSDDSYYTIFVQPVIIYLCKQLLAIVNRRIS